MQAWEHFLNKQTQELGQAVVQKWLRPLKVLRYDACNLYLEAKDAFQALWFQEHIQKKAQATLVNNNQRKIRIHLSVANEKPVEKRKMRAHTEEKFTLTFEEASPHCTFSSFAPHAGNELAFKLLCKLTGYDLSSQKLLPAQTDLGTYNPIYLFGPPGSGKTHLLMACATALKDRFLNVRYSRAETFTEHVVSAIRAANMQAFRKSYRTIDVLILDDVHIFSKKRATQEELFHSFNALHLSGKQIIVSANCSPAELKAIEPRLVSRFEWGIVLSLESPKKEALKEMLEKKAEILNFPLSSKIIDFLINTFTSGSKALIRALEALILRTHLESMSNKKMLPNHITIPLARHHLTDLIREEDELLLTSSKIISSVADHFGIDAEAITGKERSRDCVLPRQIAMYFCRKELKLSFPKIGDLFGRDHSTVMTSVKTIEKELSKEDQDFHRTISSIRKKL